MEEISPGNRINSDGDQLEEEKKDFKEYCRVWKH